MWLDVAPARDCALCGQRDERGKPGREGSPTSEADHCHTARKSLKSTLVLGRLWLLPGQASERSSRQQGGRRVAVWSCGCISGVYMGLQQARSGAAVAVLAAARAVRQG